MPESLLKTIYRNRLGLLSEVEKLLEEGADPNVVTEYSESPLRVASNNGRFDVIKLLLSKGADERQLGWTKLFHEIAYGSADTLKEAIAREGNLEHRDFWSRTPLLSSILVGDVKKTAILMDSSADVTAVGRCGKVPLEYAVQKDDVAMLDWLIDHGFDPEQRDDFLNTPLIASAERGAIKCLKALFSR